MQISITKTKAFRLKVVVLHVTIPFLFSFHDQAETANDAAADFAMIIQVCYSKDSTLGRFILHHIPLSSAVPFFFFFFFLRKQKDLQQELVENAFLRSQVISYDKTFFKKQQERETHSLKPPKQEGNPLAKVICLLLKILLLLSTSTTTRKS